MANPNSPYGFVPFKTANGGIFPLEYGDAGGTVAEGDLIIWSSGTLVVHTAAANEAIVGVAAHAATSGGKLGFYPADENNVFKCRNTVNAVIDAANIGVAYEIAGATGAMGLNTGATSNPIVRTLAFLPGTDTATAYPEVLVKIIAKSFE